MDAFAYSSISHLHPSGQRQGSVGTRRGRGQEFSMSVSVSGRHSRHTLVRVCVRQWSVTWSGGCWDQVKRERENSACFAQYEANHGFGADYSTIHFMQMRR